MFEELKPLRQYGLQGVVFVNDLEDNELIQKLLDDDTCIRIATMSKVENDVKAKFQERNKLVFDNLMTLYDSIEAAEETINSTNSGLNDILSDIINILNQNDKFKVPKINKPIYIDNIENLSVSDIINYDMHEDYNKFVNNLLGDTLSIVSLLCQFVTIQATNMSVVEKMSAYSNLQKIDNYADVVNRALHNYTQNVNYMTNYLSGILCRHTSGDISSIDPSAVRK